MKAARFTGTCAECGWHGLSLTKAGMVYRHGNAITGYDKRSCPGSGKLPSPESKQRISDAITSKTFQVHGDLENMGRQMNTAISEFMAELQKAGGLKTLLKK